MNHDVISDRLRFEVLDRAMSVLEGVGFLALSGTGAFAISSGDFVGILPAVVGLGLSALCFNEAVDSTRDIKNLKNKADSIIF